MWGPTQKIAMTKFLPKHAARQSDCFLSLPSLGNVLPILLLLLPELSRGLEVKVSLVHRHIDESARNALAHALGAAADEDTSINSIDDEPHNISLQAHLVLHILGDLALVAVFLNGSRCGGFLLSRSGEFFS